MRITRVYFIHMCLPGYVSSASFSNSPCWRHVNLIFIPHLSFVLCINTALSMMTLQRPFDETNTCYFGGTFYDISPKLDLGSIKYEALQEKRGD